MTYQVMFYGGMVGAILALIIAIVIYIKFQIAQVFEDLTGFRFGSRHKKIQNQEREETLGTNEIKIRKNYRHAEIAQTTAGLLVTERESTMVLGHHVEETMVLAQETTLLTGQVDETILLSQHDHYDTVHYFNKEVDILITHSTTII